MKTNIKLFLTPFLFIVISIAFSSEAKSLKKPDYYIDLIEATVSDTTLFKQIDSLLNKTYLRKRKYVILGFFPEEKIPKHSSVNDGVDFTKPYYISIQTRSGILDTQGWDGGLHWGYIYVTKYKNRIYQIPDIALNNIITSNNKKKKFGIYDDLIFDFNESLRKRFVIYYDGTNIKLLPEESEKGRAYSH